MIQTGTKKIVKNNSGLVGKRTVKFTMKSHHNLLKTPKICQYYKKV